MKMRQCRLRKGTHETTGWIDARAAHVGYRVQLLPDPDFWTVDEVYDRPLSEETVKANQRLNRNSLPSVQGMQ